MLRLLSFITVTAAVLFLFRRMIKYHLMADFAVKGKVWWLKYITDKKQKSAEELILDGQAREDADWLKAQTAEIVETKAFDGVSLVGHYIKGQEPERLILFFHGWRSAWTRDGGSICRWLLSEHCCVLCVEQRSQGLSGGKYMGFGILESRDCCTWTQFLAEQGNKLPVYLAGVSMGAATVLMSAGETHPGFVKGILADCGFSSPYDMVKHYGNKFFAVKEHPAMDYVDFLVRRKAHYSLKELSPAEALKKSRLPVLFIHGTADDFVPCCMSRESYEACTSEKCLLLVEGAAHARSFLKARETYIQTVKGFFHWS